LFFLATFATSRIVSLASLVAATVTPALVFLLSYAGTHVFAAVLIAVLIVGRHHQNIIRLWNGGEPRFNL
jgi:acyl phosphate:glycerol-3-phosphate acyltransferase